MLIRLFSGWDRERIDRTVENARMAGIDGVVVVAGADYPGLDEGEMVWNGALPGALSLVSEIGERMPTALAGGVLTPADALAATEAGAGLLFLSDGLVFAGPGLPKRINRLFAARCGPSEEETPVSTTMSFWSARGESSFVPQPVAAVAAAGAELGQGASAQPITALPRLSLPNPGALLGSAAVGTTLLFGSAVAIVALGLAYLFLAATVTLLPHETSYLGMGVSELCNIDECRLVDFIAHGRACNGGALVAVGIMFAWLTVGPLRRRESWAWWTLVWAGIAFFGSFLSFLAYDYLDTWHAGLMLILSVCWFAGLALIRPDFKRSAGQGAAFRAPAARAWLWSPGGRGRLMVAMFAAGLITAGLSIVAIAGSDVFVPQDVAFMRFDASHLTALSDHLIPVMAHDRAGFGGGMLALGIMFAATAWMGIRRNALGAWWALGLAGVWLIAPALIAHIAVGYTNVIHLSPVYSGSLLLAISLITLFKTMSTGSYEDAELPDV